MDLLVVSKRRNNVTRKLLLAVGVTAICYLIVRTAPGFGSFMKDNLSLGNMGAVKVLQELFPEPGRLQFIYADLGDAVARHLHLHWGMIRYVRQCHSISSSSVSCKKATHGTSSCFRFSLTSTLGILGYFNVIGSDPEGKLGEAPRPELREQGRISGACFDAARGIIPGLKIRGVDYNTPDGTCIRDYIDMTDLVDAHVKALEHAKPSKVGIYNLGTGKGNSVKQLIEACKRATGVNIKIEYLSRLPGDYAEVYSDPYKIRNELNWIARYTLEESLAIAWRWQKAHKNGDN
ncbi:unnamed protein product [Withania somnifera]